MSRIELLDASTAPLLAQSAFSGGDPGPIVAALANVPELLGPTLGFVGAALGPGAVSTRHKEFAILRTSALLGCRYCIHAHTSVALDVGLADDEVRALRGEVAIEVAFTDAAELVLIRWIDAMAAATGPVPDDVWDAARTHWADHLLLELSVTIGATMFLNRFATGFELPTAGGVLERLERNGFDTGPVAVAGADTDPDTGLDAPAVAS
jgi:AhpD family alkylhydroperoxidase